MARARSPNSIEAENMYCSGMKLIDIAEKLGVPDGTVRRWKSTQKWGNSENMKSERSEKKKASVRKQGGPIGNKNAVGSGAPEKNKNAEKHGVYSTIYWDSLEEDELSLLSAIDYNEEYQLQRQIDLYTVRERRLLVRIKKYKEDSVKSKGMLVKGITKEKGTEKGEPTDLVKTEMEAVMNTIMLLESELTKVQKAKTKAIDSLIRMRSENRKLDDAEKGNKLVDDWISSIMEELPEPEEGEGK